MTGRAGVLPKESEAQISGLVGLAFEVAGQETQMGIAFNTILEPLVNITDKTLRFFPQDESILILPGIDDTHNVDSKTLMTTLLVDAIRRSRSTSLSSEYISEIILNSSVAGIVLSPDVDKPQIIALISPLESTYGRYVVMRMHNDISNRLITEVFSIEKVDDLIGLEILKDFYSATSKCF
jgi:hypothetical protein